MSSKRRSEPGFRERAGEGWEGTHLAPMQERLLRSRGSKDPKGRFGLPQLLLGTEAKGAHDTAGNRAKLTYETEVTALLGPLLSPHRYCTRRSHSCDCAHSTQKPFAFPTSYEGKAPTLSGAGRILGSRGITMALPLWIPCSLPWPCPRALGSRGSVTSCTGLTAHGIC